MVAKPEFVSLKIGDYVMISVIERKQSKRYGCTITDIQGEKITVTNDVIGKEWVVTIENILYLEVSRLRN